MTIFLYALCVYLWLIAVMDKESKKGDRVAKVMAAAGLCSRREAERWIEAGRVAVNGAVISTPATLILKGDRVEVDGNKIAGKDQTRLFLYHKPAGLVTTAKDEKDRPTVFDSLPPDLPRLISVGRLDMNTEGLLLLTNDGSLSRYLELPATGLARTYRVRAHGRVTQDKLDTLQKGIIYEGTRYRPAQARLEKTQGANIWLTITLKEGKNREVRNMMAALGLEVNRLIRTSYGPFELGRLEKGAVEEITFQELQARLPDYFKKGTV